MATILFEEALREKRYWAKWDALYNLVEQRVANTTKEQLLTASAGGALRFTLYQCGEDEHTADEDNRREEFEEGVGEAIVDTIMSNVCNKLLTRVVFDDCGGRIVFSWDPADNE